MLLALVVKNVQIALVKDLEQSGAGESLESVDVLLLLFLLLLIQQLLLLLLIPLLCPRSTLM